MFGTSLILEALRATDLPTYRVREIMIFLLLGALLLLIRSRKRRSVTVMLSKGC